MVILASFWKPEVCCQEVLPDRPILIGQELVENAKIEKLKCNLLGDFQTLWARTGLVLSTIWDALVPSTIFYHAKLHQWFLTLVTSKALIVTLRASSFGITMGPCDDYINAVDIF